MDGDFIQQQNYKLMRLSKLRCQLTYYLRRRCRRTSTSIRTSFSIMMSSILLIGPFINTFTAEYILTLYTFSRFDENHKTDGTLKHFDAHVTDLGVCYVVH